MLNKQFGQLAGLVALVTLAAAPAWAQTESVLHNFPNLSNGSHPHGSLIGDSSGNLYGTASNGGRNGRGVIFKLDTTGRQTVLYNFKAGDGANPAAGLVMDAAGNLYGTTQHGGTNDAGVVFKLDASGHETVLHSFTGAPDGSFPVAGVVLDSAGNLYGTTEVGGINNAGVVFKLDPVGNETVLYRFTGGADGCFPRAGVILDSAGNLYGTTYVGGSARSYSGSGVVYKLDPTGHETVLRTFSSGSDGARPEAGLILDSAGNLYGTTNIGGTGGGVLFELSSSGQETVLYSFTKANGHFPVAGLVRDAAGNFYGTTESGGANDAGVVYKVDTNGQETILHSFRGAQADGAKPEGAVYLDSTGNLYGTAVNDGPVDAGVIYRLNPSGNETILCNFTFAGGNQPDGGVFRDSAGNLYGTAGGGTAALGIVYEFTVAGQFSVLHNFTGGTDGAYPVLGVVRDASGNLFGTTVQGGSANSGVVYKIDPAGRETVLYAFTGEADGKSPSSIPVLDAAGNLYGTTQTGGAANAGVVYKLDPAGNQSVLYSFSGGADGANPAFLVSDSSGNLYGTTPRGGAANAGVVYKVDLSGRQTVLYAFGGGADGGFPTSLLHDPNGNIFGITVAGYGDEAAVIYKLSPAGQETVLHTFTGTNGGGPPEGIVTDRAGNLYGVTQQGGIVYKLDPEGNFTILFTFTDTASGVDPTGVAVGSSGNLYGTAAYGGRHAGGVIFEITPAGQ